MVDNKYLSKLSQNLLEILDDDEYYDITIEVGNGPHVKSFHAHMVILNYRSPYFRKILSNNKKKNGTLTNNKKKNGTIKLSNILPEIFQIILSYIYGGRLSLDKYDTSDVIKILVAASELSLQELITSLQHFLIENKSNWIELNFNLIYQLSFENDSFLELQKYCANLMCKESNKIFNSPNFTSTSEKLLLLLIQNDNLQMSEIQIWEYVLKWGLAQNPELPSDPKNFSKENFKTLKNSIHQCIPFIRFSNLTSEEFSDKVFPYRKTLPKELVADIILYFLNPKSNSIKNSKPRMTNQQSKDIKEIKNINTNHQQSKDIKEIKEINLKNIKTVHQPIKDIKEINSKNINTESQPTKDIKEINLKNINTGHQQLRSSKNIKKNINPGQPIKLIKEINSKNFNQQSDQIDSKIITLQHSELIIKWINRLEITDKLTSLYKFKLLIRGSRDGFTPEKFHKICDNQCQTITIIKVKDSNEILGGYNPIIWKSDNSHGTTKDSFIFSFKDKDIIKNYTLSRVTEEKNAIFNSPDCGPSFGSTDLILYGSNDVYNIYYKKRSYKKPIREAISNFSIEEIEVFQIIRD